MVFQLAVKMRRQGAFNMAPVLLWRRFAFCGQQCWLSLANQPILTLPGLKKEESNTEASWPSSMQAQLINSTVRTSLQDASAQKGIWWWFSSLETLSWELHCCCWTQIQSYSKSEWLAEVSLGSPLLSVAVTSLRKQKDAANILRGREMRWPGSHPADLPKGNLGKLPIPHRYCWR